MTSSNDTAAAKKTYASVRPFFRELLVHLCAEANSEKDSIFLSLDKVMRQFWPILREVSERQERPQQVREDQDVAELQSRLGSKLFRQIYHDALDVAFDVKFGHMHEFKKGTPGPKPDAELITRISKLHSSKSWREIAKETLQAVPEGEAKGLLIEKESERYRAIVRRARRREKM